MEELFKAYGPWLLIGALMFFMMRREGCCGGHAGHNKKDGHNKDSHTKRGCH